MKPISWVNPVCLALVLGAPLRTLAAVLTFDDLPALSVPWEQYSGLGVHLYSSSPSVSVQPGVSIGNTNGWGVDGTAGPYFLGLDYGASMSVAFDVPIASFSLDAIRAAVGSDSALTLHAYDRGNYLGQQTVNLQQGGPWTNLTFNAASIDLIILFFNSYGRHGIDNLRSTPVAGSGAPVIFAGPDDQNANPGSEALLRVQADGQQPLHFQWYFRDAPLQDATNSSLWFPIVQAAQAGRSYVTVSNALGGVFSHTNTFTVGSLGPIFASQPDHQMVYVGGSAWFYAWANGSSAVTYQWQCNGTNIPGATNYYLYLYNVQTDQSGVYQAVARNSDGSATSRFAALTLLTLAPQFYQEPGSRTVSEGSHVDIYSYASGAPLPAYQWYFNGLPIPGETKYVLKLYNVTTNQLGSYSVVASNCAGISNSAEAVLTVVPATALDDWEWQRPLPQGNELSGIAYANSVFVSVGRFGAIVTSPDGSNWTARTSHTRNHLYSIAHGNGRFVAVGSAGEVLTSADGADWVRQTSGTTYNLYAVTHANDQFMAVGRFGTILASTNGAEWTAQSSVTSNHLRGITCHGGKYVAVGSRGEIVTSPDGQTWTRQVTGETRNLRAVASGNGVFVAVGNYGVTLQSSNGLDWLAAQYPSVYSGLRSILFVNGTFLAAGRYGYVWTSTDGLSWTYTYTPSAASLHDIARGAEKLVAVGDNGTLLLTTDSPTTNSAIWVDQRAGQQVYFTGSAYGNGQFIAVSPYYYDQPDTLWRSADGRDWKRTNVAPAMVLGAALFAQGTFVVGGTDYGGTNHRSIWTSTNAIDWTAHTPGVPVVNGLAYGNDRFIAVGGGSYYSNNVYVAGCNVALSTNGETWTPLYVCNGTQLQRVAAGNGAFVALDYSSVITSTNGLDWTNVFPGFSGYLYSLAYGDGVFVAVGYSYVDWKYCSFTSIDGFTWATHLLSGDGYAYCLSWANGWFFATGGRGVLLASRDGVNWVQRNTTSDAYLQTVCYGQHAYVALGFDAVIRAGELAFGPLVPAFPGGDFELGFHGQVGRVYRLQYSSDLQQWFELGCVTNSQARMTLRDLGAAAHPRRFYRLVTP
jgi:hypothetical protein